MNLKKYIGNDIKQEFRYFLYRLLKIPFNRVNLPVPITEWLPKDKAISYVDIGASRGDFATAVSSYYNVSKAVLVDPIPDNAAMLKQRFGHDDKFEIHNLAISDTVGEADFYISKELDVLSSLFKITDEHNQHFNIAQPQKTTVPTQMLDNLIPAGITIDLLKIDVQGAEHLVLSSAVETLKNTRVVFTEFSYKPMYEGSSTFYEIYQFMNGQNFRMVNISPAYVLQNGEIVQGDALFVNNKLS